MKQWSCFSVTLLHVDGLTRQTDVCAVLMVPQESFRLVHIVHSPTNALFIKLGKV